MHTHMHTYIHPCAYIYIYIYIYIYYIIFVYTSICTYARVCVAVFLFLLPIRFMAKSSPPQPSCAAAQLLKSACCGQEVVAYLRCFCCFLRIASEVTNGLMQRLFCFVWPPICGHFPLRFGWSTFFLDFSNLFVTIPQKFTFKLNWSSWFEKRCHVDVTKTPGCWESPPCRIRPRIRVSPCWWSISSRCQRSPRLGSLLQLSSTPSPL